MTGEAKPVLKKIITLLGVLSIGVFIGWNAQALHAFFSVQETIANKVTNKSMVELAVAQESEVITSSPGFFSDKSLLNNNHLGMVIELVKQDLDEKKRAQLNHDVVQYAQSLFANANGDDNTEQRLLALLGNYDTKEQILDILAKFYSRQKQYKQAITTLYNLRSMAQFDEDYQKITNRINVLSRINLKHLATYSYKSEMADFFEFMMEKEPDNFSMQMQYAEFEYKNRNYTHVEQLLSVLVHHPDYSSQSEGLIKKAQHQNDMLENGIVPVAVEKTGEHYIVSAVINNQEPVKLIIDTGATLTVLSPSVVQDLGLDVDDVQQYMEFSTANGVVRAPIMLLDSMRIQNHLVTDLQVGILPTFSHSQYDGLLGMNFLNQFNFFIDQKNSTLELVEVE